MMSDCTAGRSEPCKYKGISWSDLMFCVSNSDKLWDMIPTGLVRVCSDLYERNDGSLIT